MITTKITESTFVVGVWHLHHPGSCELPPVDWLATLYKDSSVVVPNAPFAYEYIVDERFRLHAPDNGTFDPFDGRDEKITKRKCIQFGTPETEAIAYVDALMRALRKDRFRHPWRLIIKGGIDAFRTGMATAPFAHWRTATAETP